MKVIISYDDSSVVVVVTMSFAVYSSFWLLTEIISNKTSFDSWRFDPKLA